MAIGLSTLFFRVVMEPEQKKLHTLMQQVNTVRNQKQETRAIAKQKKTEEKKRAAAPLQRKFAEIKRARKQKQYAKGSQRQSAGNSSKD